MDHAQAFRACVRIRQIEELLPRLKTQGEVQGSLHLCTGQEAVAAGFCAELAPADRIVCTYRGHGWLIARGVPLRDLLAEIMGRDSALNGGRGGSPYLSAISHGIIGENSIVGAGMPMAVGSALRSRHAPDGAVTVCVIGDGALNQGAVHEALVMAAVMKLPLVVVVENNGYAELTPTDDMFTVLPIARRAEAYGMPWEVVDGNDPLEVAATARAALAAVRDGDGPRLVEARTHRLSGHYDLDPQAYRPDGELDRAREHEPLVRLRAELGPRADEIAAEVEAEVAEALAAARAVPEPAAADVRRHLYA